MSKYNAVVPAVMKSIIAERQYQIELWGETLVGAEERDDSKSARDWITYIVAYLGYAAGRESDWGRRMTDVRRYFVKVAALAIAALESFDRRFPDSIPPE